MPLELVVKVEYFPASGAVPLPRVPSGKAPALWRPILDVGPLCSGADLPWFLLLQLFQWLAAAETARGLAKSAPRTCCGFIRQRRLRTRSEYQDATSVQQGARCGEQSATALLLRSAAASRQPARARILVQRPVDRAAGGQTHAWSWAPSARPPAAKLPQLWRLPQAGHKLQQLILRRPAGVVRVVSDGRSAGAALRAVQLGLPRNAGGAAPQCRRPGLGGQGFGPTESRR